MNYASIGLLSGAFQLLWFVLAMIAMAFLIRLYLRTRLSGWLWLLAALVVLPQITRVANVAFPFFVASHGYTAQDAALFSIVLYGLIGLAEMVLVVVAIFLLERKLVAANPALPAAVWPAR